MFFANECLHLEGRGIAPRHKSPVCQFSSMFGSNCIPSTLDFDQMFPDLVHLSR